MRALILQGGYTNHEPGPTAAIAADLLRREGVLVEVADTLERLRDSDALLGLDLIVMNWTQGTLDRDQVTPLLDAVRAGVGFTGWHGGMGDAFRYSPSYQFMCGGQWVSHPGGQVTYRVRIGPTRSPITAGLRDFTVTSEQYYMHVDPVVTVLATTHVALGAALGDAFDADAQAAVDADQVEGVRMPVTWIKRFGKGRVFYTSLGHKARVFDIPEVSTMLCRGLLWAAEGKTHAGG
jgi:type 1 glutamine amidotransferase